MTQAELRELFKPQGTPGGMMKFLLVLVGLLLPRSLLLGAILFYKRSYIRFMQPGELRRAPRLHHSSPIVKIGMLIGARLIWAVLFIGVQILVRLVLWFGGETMQENPNSVLIYLGANILLTIAVLFCLNRWRGWYLNTWPKSNGMVRRVSLPKRKCYPIVSKKGFILDKDCFIKSRGTC